jgi:hypothetical protein
MRKGPYFFWSDAFLVPGNDFTSCTPRRDVFSRAHKAKERRFLWLTVLGTTNLNFLLGTRLLGPQQACAQQQSFFLSTVVCPATVLYSFSLYRSGVVCPATVLFSLKLPLYQGPKVQRPPHRILTHFPPQTLQGLI